MVVKFDPYVALMFLMAILCSLYVLYLFCCSKLKLSSTIRMLRDLLGLSFFIQDFYLVLSTFLYLFVSFMTGLPLWNIVSMNLAQ